MRSFMELLSCRILLYTDMSSNNYGFNMKSRIVSFLILSVFLSLLFTSAGNTLSSDLKIDLPSGTDSGYINVNGGKLYYEMAGEGEYIVLLHDGLIHREIWDEQFPFFAKNYRVVRYDRRGYGKSPVPHDQYSNIKDLDQLFIQLRIDKAVIFGMSSGGGLAIDFTLAHPEKVTALVLIGAVVSGYGYSAHMLNRGGHVNSLTRLLSDSKKTLQYFAWDDPYEIYVNNVKAKEKIIKLLQANMIDLNQEKHNFSLPPDRPAARFLSEIKVPALVLAGEYDIPDVHSHAGVIEFGISNAKREIIMNSGHLVPLEQPEAFNKSVLIFLDGLEFFNVLNSGGVKAAAEFSRPNAKLNLIFYFLMRPV